MKKILIISTYKIWQKVKNSIPYDDEGQNAENYFFEMLKNLKGKLELSNIIFFDDNDYLEKIRNENIKMFMNKYKLESSNIESIIENLNDHEIYILENEKVILENSKNVFQIDYSLKKEITIREYIGGKLQQIYMCDNEINKSCIIRQIEGIEAKNINSRLNLELEKFNFENLNLNKLEILIDDYEFELEINKVDYDIQIIKNENELSQILNKIDQKIFFKILYDGEKSFYGEPIGIGFILDDDFLICIYKFKNITEIQILKDIMENNNIEKFSHHIKDDLILLRKYDIKINKIVFDTMIAHYILDPSADDYDICETASKFLKKTIDSEEKLLGKGKKKLKYIELEDNIFNEYLQSYVSIIKESYEVLSDKIDEQNMKYLYESVEIPLIEVLGEMEYEGVKIDLNQLAELKNAFQESINYLTSTIYFMAGQEFNINSPKQLGKVLFEDLGLPVIKKTKTGYSTNAEVLDKLSSNHEIIPLILDYRKLSKLKSTYVEGLEILIDSDNKIHSSFNQTITSTGRISSTQPNLQNIPVRTKEGRWIRKIFIPSDNRKLVDADYSQIELRVLAHISKDDNLINAYKHGLDIHSKTASEVFKVDIEAVTDQQRRTAKAVNFGIVYGISEFGLSRDLGISMKESRTYIDEYLKLYEKVQDYMTEIVQSAKDKGFVSTIFDRRRYIEELNSSNKNIQGFGERMALNTPIQGSAADIIKIAMIKVYDALKRNNLKSKLILQVHDELIIDTFEDELEIVEKILREEMENAVELSVPLTVDLKIGDSWYETK